MTIIDMNICRCIKNYYDYFDVLLFSKDTFYKFEYGISLSYRVPTNITSIDGIYPIVTFYKSNSPLMLDYFYILSNDEIEALKAENRDIKLNGILFN